MTRADLPEAGVDSTAAMVAIAGWSVSCNDLSNSSEYGWIEQLSQIYHFCSTNVGRVCINELNRRHVLFYGGAKDMIWLHIEHLTVSTRDIHLQPFPRLSQ